MKNSKPTWDGLLVLVAIAYILTLPFPKTKRSWGYFILTGLAIFCVWVLVQSNR